MTLLGVFSHAVGAAAYLFLGILLLTAWRGRLLGGLLVGVVLLSCLWCAALAVHSATGNVPAGLLVTLELLRDAGWLAFGFKILRHALDDGPYRVRLRAAEWAVYALCAGLVLALLGTGGLAQGSQLSTVGFLAVAVTAWILVEQIYRNTRLEHRWSVKFLCLGMGGLFAYDFAVYAGAVLVGRVDGDLWTARGLVQAMAVPLIAVAAARNPQWSLEVFVSRHIVFHTATLLGAGAYLLVTAAVGYYIQDYGGTWGGVAQIAFLCVALLLLCTVFFSGGVRSRMKVFLSKHFFKNKYDYRDEWLRFSNTLSVAVDVSAVQENVIRATCAIVESPGGTLWMRRGESIEAVSQWQCPSPRVDALPADSALPEFLRRTGWVLFLDELRADPARYDGLALPPVIADDPQAWIVVPLTLVDELRGFIVLRRSGARRNLDWEDSDLFRTVGQQAASYLALSETSEALAESRQFEAFSRLSSYVVHDLKNVVAQLSLVGENAKRHRDNPDFVRDAFETMENATKKMKRMLAQLRQGSLGQSSTRMVNLGEILRSVVGARATQRPVPELDCDAVGLVLRAEPHRLASVLEHLVQNAQEATAVDGKVWVRGERTGETLKVTIGDTGCGMGEEFLRERLFKPFDTTKGNAGMGIGAYEARDFVVSNGGKVEVRSTPGEGTVFTLEFPAEFDASEPATSAALMGAGVE